MQTLIARNARINASACPARWWAALDWALETDTDARAILRGCPPLDLAHGVLQASDRRINWIVAVSATAIGIQRVDTIAGATAARSLRLPEHLKGSVDET